MKASPLIWGILKPAIKRKFKLETITSLLFIANQVEDTLELEGEGYEKNNLNLIKRKTEILKLSDHGTYTALFMDKIKTQLDYKTISCVYFRVNFDTKECYADIFFIGHNDLKDSAKLKIKV